MNSSMIDFLNAASRMEEFNLEYNEQLSNQNETFEQEPELIDKNNYTKNERLFQKKSNKSFKPFKNQSISENHKEANLVKRTSSISSLLPAEVFEPTTEEGKSSLEFAKKAALDFRKKSLGEKIQAIFNLKEVEELKEEFPCWLMSSVLLQGTLYLTDKSLLYYAHIPQAKNEVLKAGFLTKKLYAAYSSTYWFVLRDHSLAYFENSTDIYCPYGMIDLKQVIAVQRSNSRQFGFKVVTINNKLNLQTDTEISLKEWITAIKKAVFKAKNNDHVKIVIPLSNIVDAELNPTFNFAETLRIKSVETNFALDDHFFVFFENGKMALKCCQEAVRKSYALNPTSPHRKGSLGSTQKLGLMTDTIHTENSYNKAEVPTMVINQSEEDSSPKSHEDKSDEGLLSPRSIYRFIPKQLRPGRKRSESNPINSLSRKSSFSDFNPDDFVASNINSSDNEAYLSDDARESKGISLNQSETKEKEMDSSEIKDSNRHRKGVSLDFKLSNWINIGSIASSIRSIASDKLDTPSFNYFDSLQKSKRISPPTSPPDNFLSEVDEGSSSFFQLPSISAPSLDNLIPSEESIYKDLAIPSTETTLCTSGCLLLRVVPRWGRILVTSNFVCFYSKLVAMTIKVIIPMSDLRIVENQPGLRLLHHGLSIETISSQEMFLEFRSSKVRDRIVMILTEQMSKIADEKLDGNNNNLNLIGSHPNANLNSHDLSISFSTKNHNKWIQEYDANNTTLPIIPNNQLKVNKILSSLPPNGPMHITCLTIGTRGDVQPYIALCKGLMKHGHTCRIATHAEYQEWIESHGIEFKVVAGDPGELIKLCVDNGMFSISFLKEGVTKFRTWIDQLLETAWYACQGTDLLIESPTAMAGIHIAEKLDIPFFSCFPMPWTRTRAFPHPFAIPERQMGGSYNYMTYVIIEQVLWKGTSWQVNNWRKNLLGLGPVSIDQLNPHRVPYLYSFSPAIVPPPFDWHDWIHPCGFFFLDDPQPGWEAPKELIEFLEAKPKPIYIGFGSITVPDPKGTIQTIIDASIEANVRIILSEGWSNRMANDGQPMDPIVYPENVYLIKSAPHDWLFPKVAAVMHHGGAGTTAAGLRAGVPCIIKPFFGDQYFWAMQVERMSTGIYLKKLTVSKLTQALKDVTDQKMIEKAAIIGKQIRSENGVENAISFLYRDLQYARTRLTKSKDEKLTNLDSNINLNSIFSGDEESSDFGWLMVGEKSPASKLEDKPIESEHDTKFTLEQ